MARNNLVAVQCVKPARFCFSLPSVAPQFPCAEVYHSQSFEPILLILPTITDTGISMYQRPRACPVAAGAGAFFMSNNSHFYRYGGLGMNGAEPMAVYVAGLYEMQQWECLNKQYAPGYFERNYPGFVKGLSNGSGKTFLKILQDPKCIEPGCGLKIDLSRSVLDHIIPRKKGGPDILENRIPLCRGHNSSKGTKDLIEWWMHKSHRPIDLPRNILAIYARVYWQFGASGILLGDAPQYIHDFFMERARTCKPELEPFHMIAMMLTAERIAQNEYGSRTGGSQ